MYADGTRVRTLLKRSYGLSCAYYVASNLVKGVRFRAGDIETNSGTVLTGRAIDGAIGYIEEVFADYKRYSGVSRFSGKVAEVGPGDNCGVGLLFLADGCASVDLVDRFFSRRSADQNASLYRALMARNADVAARLEGADVRDEGSFAGLRRRFGDDASAEAFFSQSTGYDLIVSRSVMEHVYDPIIALRRMAAALTPGGMLLHKVDLRDHGMFTPAFHELKFLEVPDWLYPSMTRNAGRPNRLRVDEYRRALRETLPDHDLLVTYLAGVGDIEPHVRYDQISAATRERSVAYVRRSRRHIAASLQSVSDEDLSVGGVFIVARKPLTA
jgi:SAM-dependent methyltransferase